MRLTQSVSMDFSVHGIPPRIYGKQDDSLSRVVEISLYQAGTAWTIPDSAVMMLHYRTPVGHIGIYDTLPDGSAAISASENVVSAVLVDQIFAIPGVVECELRIIDAISGVSTWTFLVEVEPGTPSTETIPSDYINVLTSLAAQVAADADRAKKAADSVDTTTLMSKEVFDPTREVEAAGGIIKYLSPQNAAVITLADADVYYDEISYAEINFYPISTFVIVSGYFVISSPIKLASYSSGPLPVNLSGMNRNSPLCVISETDRTHVCTGGIVVGSVGSDSVCGVNIASETEMSGRFSFSGVLTRRLMTGD